MTNEQMIEQLAEIRAQLMANMFLNIATMERLGVKSEDQLHAIDVMMTRCADHFENHMRKIAGLSPRAEPRELALKKLEEDAFNQVDRDRLMEF